MADSWEDLFDVTERFMMKPNWIDTPKSNFEPAREIIQASGTSIDLYDLAIPGRRWTYGYTNMSKEDEHYILDFFTDRQGRLKKFWLPIWKNCFRLDSDVIGHDKFIDIENVFLHDVDTGLDRIFFEMIYGDYISRMVYAVIEIGNVDRLALWTKMDRGFSQNQIKYFGRLAMVRFDIDDLEIDFKSDQYSTCTIDFKELPDEYTEEPARRHKKAEES